jgi:Berberine and berberine like
MRARPLPLLPSEHHGRLVLMATLVHAGAGRAADGAIAPFRALAAPFADTLRPMPYRDVFPPVDDDFHPVVALRTLFLDGVDRPAAETIIERLRSATAPMAGAQLRVLGGAMARVPAEARAFAHRDRRLIANVAAMYQRPDERELHEAWARDFAAELGPRRPGAYVAFLGDEGEARVRDAYPDSTWKRLAAIKARYDPDNLFRLNQNVPPEARSRGVGQRPSSWGHRARNRARRQALPRACPFRGPSFVSRVRSSTTQRRSIATSFTGSAS